MKKLLVVIDMQNDFIDGALGSPEAEAIVPKVVEKIKSWDGDVVCTLDTHGTDYMNTLEGKYLPVEHCIEGSMGWEYNNEVAEAVQNHPNHLPAIFKPTFGATDLVDYIVEFTNENGYSYDYIELIGLCTDICVVSNALVLRAFYPNTEIAVDASCCAGTSPENHEAALRTMQSCQIQILNKENA